MGRCNNKRAQEAAAARQNVPSRARFSKGPPNKKGRGGRGSGGRNNNNKGRGGRNGGRGGGRGGRGRGGGSRDTVKQNIITKISQRVQSKQRDAGGISLLPSSSSSSSSIKKKKVKKRHALDGIDITKLDEIKLSEETCLEIERILMDLGVVQPQQQQEKGRGADSAALALDGKKKEEQNVSSFDNNNNKNNNYKKKQHAGGGGGALDYFVQDELMATFNHMDSDSDSDEEEEEEEEHVEINEDNVYSLSAPPIYSSTTNTASMRNKTTRDRRTRGGGGGSGGYEEYEDEPDYSSTIPPPPPPTSSSSSLLRYEEEEEEEEDEYGFMDSTMWAEQQLRLEQQQQSTTTTTTTSFTIQSHDDDDDEKKSNVKIPYQNDDETKKMSHYKKETTDTTNKKQQQQKKDETKKNDATTQDLNSNNTNKKDNDTMMMMMDEEKEEEEEEASSAVLYNKTPLFLHLTSQLSFTTFDAERACRAVENWDVAISKKNDENSSKNQETKKKKEEEEEVDDDNLALAMDWLCLHLTEQELKSGFKPNPKASSLSHPTTTPTKQSSQRGAVVRGSSSLLLAGTGATKPIPHSSISVAPPLNYQKEKEEAKKQRRKIGFARLGFTTKEIMQATTTIDDMTTQKQESDRCMMVVEEDEVALRILLSLLERQEEELEEQESGKMMLMKGDEKEKANATDLEYAYMEREQEIQALEAIFPTEFEIVSSSSSSSSKQHSKKEEKDKEENEKKRGEQRYKLKVTPITPLLPPAQSNTCTLHVFTKTTYPTLSSPLLLFTNNTLPPTLLRRINVALIRKAKESVGEPIVFEIMEYLAEYVPIMQREFGKEQRAKEFEAEQLRMRREVGHDVGGATTIKEEKEEEEEYDEEEEDEVDGKKLSRRQKAKLKAAEKAYNRPEVLAALEEERKKKQAIRIEKAQADRISHRSNMAMRAVEEREKEKIQEEAEKAARAAMNAAFNRGESVEVAREEARIARIRSLRENGEDVSEFFEEEEEKKVDDGKGYNDKNKKKNQSKGVSIDQNQTKGSAKSKVDTISNENNNVDAADAAASSKTVSIGDKDNNNNDDGDDTTQQNKRTATQATLAFTERLKAFYQKKAKEKAMRDVKMKEGGDDDDDDATSNNVVDKENNEEDDDDDFCGLHLTKPDVVASPQNTEQSSSHHQHEPAPVFVPSRALTDVMKDVLKDQSEQPWLVSPEARAPTLDYHPDASVQTKDQLTPEQLEEQAEISRQMKKDLQRKLKAAEQWEKKLASSAASAPPKRNPRSEPPSQKFHKMMSQRSRLPAYKMKDEIVKTIAMNQITVISGDTGCGKTTQVPQLVLDDLIWNNRGAEANIIVTQPRRISAIGVSERIASERCERVGETAGYSIRLENKRSAKTRLLLCTTGILLRRLQVDPDLASVSHVFVDEVHERDLNTDFLLIILKDLLSRRKSLKLVLMSATLNADTFSKYFDGCPTTSIPGRAHPVKELRLEDALQATGYQVEEDSDYVMKKKDSDNQLSKSALKKLYKDYNKNVINSLAIVDENIINYELLAKLLEYITMNEGDGAILCFMPGMQEITKAIEELYKNEFFTDPRKVVIYPLHSSLSTTEQTAVFDVPPEGVRKIVISTNIAETSITIEDVVYVVDAGRVKENRHDEVNQMPTLVECWVSRASAKQRRGRAGRVRPGICYHMYSSHTHNHKLEEYQLPEMLRVGLEDLVLQVLLLDLGEPSAFLTKAVNPPSALAIKNSLKLLEGLGAVECEWDDDGIVRAEDENGENSDKVSSCEVLNVNSGLTALGFHLATLPVDPRVGKMMIYGALFGCIDPALTIAASMSARNPFMSPFDKRDEADAARKEFSTEGSDHLATLTAFNRWKSMRQREGQRSVNEFLQESFLSRLTLFQIEDLRKQFSDLLVDIGFLPKGYRCDRGSRMGSKGRDGLDFKDSNDSDPNSNSKNLHLLKAILCAGLYPNIIVAPRNLVGPENDRKKEVGECAFQSQKGEVYLHPCCISFKEKHLGSRYCCYHEIVKTSKIYVRDCTTVSECALLLFGGSLKIYHTHGVVTIDNWLKFRIAAKPATLVKHLRAQMESMLLRKIVSPDDDVTNAPEGRALIQAVSTLLKREIKETPDRSAAAIVRPWNSQENGRCDEQRKGRGNRPRSHGGGRGRGRGGRGGSQGRGSYRGRGGGRGRG